MKKTDDLTLGSEAMATMTRNSPEQPAESGIGVFGLDRIAEDHSRTLFLDNPKGGPVIAGDDWEEDDDAFDDDDDDEEFFDDEDEEDEFDDDDDEEEELDDEGDE